MHLQVLNFNAVFLFNFIVLCDSVFPFITPVDLFYFAAMCEVCQLFSLCLDFFFFSVISICMCFITVCLYCELMSCMSSTVIMHAILCCSNGLYKMDLRCIFRSGGMCIIIGEVGGISFFIVFGLCGWERGPPCGRAYRRHLL